MAAIVPRTSDWKSTYALVVISPAMTTRPVAVRVSQATRLDGSSVRQASRIASEIWSAILSGWPSVTDSEVNRYRFFDAKLCVSFVHASFYGVQKTDGLWIGRDPRKIHAAATERTANGKSSKKATRPSPR